MDLKQTLYFVGCAVLGPDITRISQELNLPLKMKLLPGGLHSRPDELRRRLQEAVDQAGQNTSCSRIIVGYGLCGRGTVGIKAPDVPLVIPKVHDCIALFMGSDQAYQEEFAKFPGTYYISAGWYLEKETPKEGLGNRVWVGSQHMDSGELLDKYGEAGKKEIIDFFSTWQKHYQRAAFIDTGIGRAETYAEHARDMAARYNWEYQRIKGDCSLMERMLSQTVSDDQILVVPPQYVTVYSALGNNLAAAAPADVDKRTDTSPRIVVLDEDTRSDLKIRYGLGVDAGGTYTDAALYDFQRQRLIGKHKALTTRWDFSIGIDEALSGLDAALLDTIELVSVSTTLATNAIVEGEGQKAGLVIMTADGNGRDELIKHSPTLHVSGRMSIAGQEMQPVDPDEIRRAARRLIDGNGVTAFAVSGYAGAVNPAHELEVKKILQEETGMVVTCGHELSDLLNFVIRAQTAVLNARIIPRMIKFFQELDAVLRNRSILAPVMVVKGDGTLMSADMARQRPVETILSGPAASVAGARLLTGRRDAMVVDIGGTTTDTAELRDEEVRICENGARVGGLATHVKALNMRTIGLGGDSLVFWQEGMLRIGPQRVAPMVWADSQSEAGVSQALAFLETFLENHPGSGVSQLLFTAMPGTLSFEPTPEEDKLFSLLIKRPYTLEELAASMNLLSVRLLTTQRLEANGLIQCCGLTPTDILHALGRFRKWNPAPAWRMLHILASLSRTKPEILIRRVVQTFENDLARELLKKQLSIDVDVDTEKESCLAGHLLDSMLTGETSDYTLSARLHHPIIGIGAPVGYFLPGAAKKLNAEVVIPEDADVANALGAITSQVRIRRKASIRPDHQGRFIVENIPGGRQFAAIDPAESWAVEHLKNIVQEKARYAGTSRQTVEMEIRDRLVPAADGTDLFLERTLQATLSGNPDLSLASDLSSL